MEKSKSKASSGSGSGRGGNRGRARDSCSSRSRDGDSSSDHGDSLTRRRPFQNPDEELCAFCLDRIRNPVKLQCNHSFCQSCLELYREERNWVAERCPLCRRSLRYAEKFPGNWRLFFCMLIVLIMFSLGPFYLLLQYW